MVDVYGPSICCAQRTLSYCQVSSSGRGELQGTDISTFVNLAKKLLETFLKRLLVPRLSYIVLFKFGFELQNCSLPFPPELLVVSRSDYMMHTWTLLTCSCLSSLQGAAFRCDVHMEEIPMFAFFRKANLLHKVCRGQFNSGMNCKVF